MSDETRPFAVVEDECDIRFETNADQAECVRCVCLHQCGESEAEDAEDAAEGINAAVQARERIAAVKALRAFADGESLKDDFGHGEVITKHDVRTSLRAEADAIERGEAAIVDQSARERIAAVKALREAAKKWPNGRGKFESGDFGLWLEAEAAAIEAVGPIVRIEISAPRSKT